MVVWGRRMAQGDRAYLLDFLQRVVGGRIVGGQEPAAVERRPRS